MIPLNYHHLFYFYTVAKTGSIAKATETLLLAQPTISAQIKELERFFKRPLFERRNRRLVLTEDGRRVLDYAESIFGLGRELEDVFRDRAPGAPTGAQLGVATGTPRALAHRLLERALADFPGAPLIVREGSTAALAEDLRQQRLDLVLSTSRLLPGTKDEFITKRVGRIPLVFAAVPRRAAAVRRWPDDLGRQPMVLPAGGAYREVRDLWDQWGISPKVLVEVDDVELARRLALGGHGVAVLNALTAAVQTPGARLVPVGKPTGLFESVYLTAGRRKYTNPLAAGLLGSFSIPLPQ